MPHKRNYFTRPQDLHQYINDLEDVYSMEVNCKVWPVDGPEGTYPGRVELTSIWADDTWNDGPLCTLCLPITLKPQAAYVKTMLNALIEFTYQCVEAHLCALEVRN